MHVLVRQGIDKALTIYIDSILITVEEFRKLIDEKFKVAPERQRLLFRGRELEDGKRFHDYKIKQNDLIQLVSRILQSELPSVAPVSNKVVEEKPKDKFEDSSDSKYYRVGDLVDGQDITHGAWFEGEIVRIVKNPESTNTKAGQSSQTTSNNNLENLKDDGLLYLVKFKVSSDDEPMELKLACIRPRARTKLNIDDLKPGQRVMVNYNTDDIKERGYWYDLEISDIKSGRKVKHLIGTLYMGHENVREEDCKVVQLEDIYQVETHKLLTDRTDADEKLMKTDTELRYLAFYCLKCRDDNSKDCKNCGCSVCSKKDNADNIILCDECDKGYHIQCLTPPLDKLPEEDNWYCPECKTDVNSIVKSGSTTKQQVRNVNTSKDWGRGMACAGRTTTCTIVPPDHFGAIPGVPVGTCWKYRIQASEAGVHRPPVSGIHGKATIGAFSIVLAAGYEDDKDDGLEFTYTGSGGRDLSGNKRTAEQNHDQKLTRENEALAKNCNIPLNQKGGEAKDWKKGKPVRVIRSEKLVKHNPKYAPKEGLRYDGIYKVVKYWQQTGQSGFKVWRYLLKRDDPAPAPWEENGVTLPIIYPDNYLEAQNEKLSKKRKAEDSSSKATKKQKSDDAKSESSPVVIPEHKLTEEQSEKISKDTINKKLWDLCLEKLPEGEKKFVDCVQSTFACIICQEICVKPITTPCLHNMCLSCMKRSFAAEVYTCPYCRQDLTKEYKFKINEELSAILKCLLPGYDAR